MASGFDTCAVLLKSLLWSNLAPMWGKGMPGYGALFHDNVTRTAAMLAAFWTYS